MIKKRRVIAMILFIVVFIIGLLLLVFPKHIWEITESWKSYDATEPSDLYIISTRIGSGLCILIAIAGIIVSIIY